MVTAVPRRRPGNGWRSSGFIRTAARVGTLTAFSSISEPGGAGLDRLSEAECAWLQGLNGGYRKKFHFPFVVCVCRHTKESIPRQFAQVRRTCPAPSLKRGP
jgi:2-oxo-4-hydroxy-4-carboxy--5-ureidoimidazoline (OHCU) decarboxylase